MTELEKAARTLIELAQLENEEPGVPGYWCPEETVLMLRAALEAEAGWECCAYVGSAKDRMLMLVDGYEYMLMQRPLREDGDETPPYSMGDDYG